jgi:hypothetical protein
MGRYDIEEVDIGDDEQNFDTGNRQIAGRQVDHPKRSPIRRKDKWRQEDGIKAKTKRNYRKIQYRLKYNWKGE